MSAAKTRENPEKRYRRAAGIGGLILVLITVGVFVKRTPFTSSYEIGGVVASSNQLSVGSDVRIAGLRVGEVRAIDKGPGASSLVTMQIQDSGRPIHADATLAVKPRLILEGNAYIELRPGTPKAGELASGQNIPLAQTRVTPQLDQVLDVLDQPTRRALHASIGELAAGLGPAPGPNGSQRESGAQGLRTAVREMNGALGSVTQVARGLQGTDRGDLSNAVRGSADVAGQLATNPQALAEVVTNLNRVTASLASRDRDLAATVSGLDGVMRTASPSLKALNSALPVLTDFGNELQPAARVAPASLREANGFLAQVAGLMQTSELPRLLTELKPVSSELPRFEKRLESLFGFVTPVMDCVSSRIVPTLDSKVADGKNTSGDPVWLDFVHSFAGWVSGATSIDGNGGTFRAGTAGGEQTVAGILPGLTEFVGRMPDIEGVRPTWLGDGVEPGYRPDVPCTSQLMPDLSKRSGRAPRLRKLSPDEIAERRSR